MPLSQLEFLVLNNLADEPEPFSSVYVQMLDDLGGNEDDDFGWEDAAVALAGLCELGMAEPVNGGSADGAEIVAHYTDLDAELVEHVSDEMLREMDFVFSGGEWLYRMTSAGDAEWQKPEYAPYYPHA